MTGILLGLSDPHPDQLVRSEVWIRGSGSASGSVPKCYESGTLVITYKWYPIHLSSESGSRNWRVPPVRFCRRSKCAPFICTQELTPIWPDPDPDQTPLNHTVLYPFQMFWEIEVYKVRLPRLQGFIGLELCKIRNRFGLAWLCSCTSRLNKKNSFNTGTVTDPDSTLSPWTPWLKKRTKNGLNLTPQPPLPTPNLQAKQGVGERGDLSHWTATALILWSVDWVLRCDEMEIRIQIGIKTMPLNNTGILASKITVSSNIFFED